MKAVQNPSKGRMYKDVKGEDFDFETVEDTNNEQNQTAENPDSSPYSRYRGVFLPKTDQPEATPDSTNHCQKRTEGKTSLFYEDSVSGRSFRFILHRKNARKADIYACAKCKSRRKYVRVMVQNDKFLCDPASLDHICYMTPLELQKERLNNKKLKQMKIRKLIAELAPEGGNFLDGGVSPTYISESQEIIYASSLFDAPQLAFSNRGSADGSQCVTPSSEVVTEADSVTENYQSSPCDADNDEGKALKVSQLDDEPQASDQEPYETKCVPLLRDEVCLQSIRMALERLPSHAREKAHVDILHYVYTTIFEKYLNNHSD